MPGLESTSMQRCTSGEGQNSLQSEYETADEERLACMCMGDFDLGLTDLGSFGIDICKVQDAEQGG